MAAVVQLQQEQTVLVAEAVVVPRACQSPRPEGVLSLVVMEQFL
tara:strand:+ start:435 stop:566 length:132 start_codon:yes stop_codon:yes gene_type:complete